MDQTCQKNPKIRINVAGSRNYKLFKTIFDYT